jgi:hypothetical protein
VNKVIIAGIVIVILGLISFLAIGFVNNSNQILEERNKVSAELQKLKESSVEDVMFNKLIVGYGTKGGDDVERIAGTFYINDASIYEGKIIYIECKVDFEKEQHQNYLSILCTSNNADELNDRLWSPIEYEALLKLTNIAHVWKSGDTFSGYVKVLPMTEQCKMYSNGQYWVETREATHTKFNGDRCHKDFNPMMAIHFEEVKMIYINSEHVFFGMR